MSAMGASGMGAGVRDVEPVVQVQVGQVEMHTAGQERDCAQTETDQKTDEIQIRPGHDRLLGVFSTSINRSQRPGFSRMVSSRMRHIRESWLRATASSA